MKTISVDEFKAHFSNVLKETKSGEEFAVVSGDNNEIVGHFVSNISQRQRKLGILEGTAFFRFDDEFELSDNEFLKL